MLQVLKNLGKIKNGDKIGFSGEIGRAKPHPEIFEDAFKDYNLDEILHIGDNPIADVDGSQKCGSYALWVNSREHYRNRTKVEPTLTSRLSGEIRDITELKDLLGMNHL